MLGSILISQEGIEGVIETTLQMQLHTVSLIVVVIYIEFINDHA